MRIKALSVGVYRGGSPTEISVAARLEDERIAENVWRAGREIRIDATGDASREAILALINDALDRLEQIQRKEP